MSKLNKQRLDEGFDALRYTDRMFNKAAGLTEGKELTFEERLKKKLLKENFETEAPVEGEEFEEGQENAVAKIDLDLTLEDGSEISFQDTIGDNEEGVVTDVPSEGEGEEEFEIANFEDEEEGESLEEYNELQPRGENRVTSTHDHDSEENDEDREIEEGLNLIESLVESVENPLEAEGEELPTEGIEGETSIEGEGEELPAEGIEGEMPVEGEVGMEGMDDLGGDISMGGGSIGGGSLGGEDLGGEGLGTEMPTASTIISQPEDIDSLIANMVPNEENTIMENKELRDLGYQDLKNSGFVGNKVKMTESKQAKIKALTEAIEKETGKKVILEDDKLGNAADKSTKLPNKYPTPGSVQGATEHKKVEHTGKAKVVKSVAGFTMMDLGDEEIKSNTPTDTTTSKVNVDSKSYSKVMGESATKSKALLLLAEKHVKAEDEIAKLKLENFKLNKVNSLFTLLPELNSSTKKTLIERFDRCGSSKEAVAVYNEVVSLVKESNTVKKSVKNSLNEAVIRSQKSSIKYLGESVADQSDDITDYEQARKDDLMGIGKGLTYGNSSY